MNLTPIGVIHSPYQSRVQAPRQGRISNNEIVIEVFPDFTPALRGIDQYSHLIVLYWGDRSNREVLQSTTPHNTKQQVGVFSNRSPNRPNPIAFCVASLVRQEGNQLVVRWVDALDGSPLIDIKPYSPALDSVENAANGQIPNSLTEIAKNRRTDDAGSNQKG